MVRLIPKKGQGKPSVKAHGEGGSFRTKYGYATAQGEEEPLQLPLTLVEFTVKVTAPVGAEAPVYATVAESVALAAP